jgi:hypothetical protein
MIGSLDPPTPRRHAMSRLIRLDQTGHTELAQWSPGDGAALQRARSMMEAELARGYFAVAGAAGGGVAEQVRELPDDAELVILRRPIAGG